MTVRPSDSIPRDKHIRTSATCLPLGGGSHLGKPYSYSDYIIFGAIIQFSLEPVAWPWSVVPKFRIRMDSLAIGRKSVIQFCFATPLKAQNGKMRGLE